MTNPEPHVRKPTKPQLDYLKDLAMRTGQSFAYPRTFAQADAEIKRLESTKRTRAVDRRRETQQVRQDFATHRGGAAAVRPSEIAGYGSGATWSEELDPDYSARESLR